MSPPLVCKQVFACACTVLKWCRRRAGLRVVILFTLYTLHSRVVTGGMPDNNARQENYEKFTTDNPSVY